VALIDAHRGGGLGTYDFEKLDHKNGIKHENIRPLS
jgi:hypothetical protein